MSGEFNPRARVAEMGTRAWDTVMHVANGQSWTFATIYAAAESLQSTRPRIAKRLHNLGAEWAVNYREVRA